MAHDELITRIKNSDREAFNTLFRERYSSVLAYARLFFIGKDPEWAEDIVQEVFYGLWRNRKSLNADGSSLQRYLLQAVHNRSINYLHREDLLKDYRNENQKKIFSLMEDWLSPEANHTLADIFNEELHVSLDSAISSLTPKCQEVFRMSYVDGLSTNEISEKLGISPRTVESHIHNALKILRLKLSDSFLIAILSLGVFSNFS